MTLFEQERLERYGDMVPGTSVDDVLHRHDARLFRWQPGAHRLRAKQELMTKSIVDTIAEIAAELPKRDLRALERKDIAMMKALEQQVIARVCHPDVACPNCNIPLVPEHAHSTCPQCHYRDSCCF